MPALVPCPEGHQWRPHTDPVSGVRQVFCAVCGLIQSAPEERETVTDSSGPAPGDSVPTRSLPPQPAAAAGPSAETLSYVATPPPPRGAAADSVPPAGPAPQPARGTLPRLDGYEILGVLGRGGMGVVYKARQVSLKRLVALKMILAGPHAGSAELRRFRVEAEAVAHLQHPNIVHIYETGEQDGAPYFSLEFVDGGSLARKLAGQPLPGRQAAELVETLARAMHHAHERGVIHRDLKPANVLLTADGTPKITDFGLAKRLEGDVGQTQSGAIMGTPSYMAPEQAQGKVREIGPLADVYALGAVLYELLTGRPPFRGDTLLETLRKVMTEEVVPPSRLQSRIHRDLETVCLKALTKDPRGRYPSALALAEDLARFNAGEAILARREGVARRLWRKVRRSPVTAASLLVVVLVLLVAGGTVSWLRQAGRVSDVSRAFEAGLSADDWSPGHVEHLEALLADLERLAPDQVGLARARLLDRFARSIHDGIYAPKSLERADVDRLTAALDLLESRDAGRAGSLRDELQGRQRGLQRSLDVRPPFDTLAQALPADHVRVADNALVAQAPPNNLVHTRVPSQGTVEFEATFDFPSWGKVAQVGVLVNADADPQHGYAFLLCIAPARADPGEAKGPPPANLEEARRRNGGRLSLQVRRDGALQRAQLVPVAAGPLHLRARREGDRLSVQANDQPPLVFEESFPAGRSSAGAFALYWPDGVRVTGMQAWQQLLGRAAIPLEQGDDAYGRSQFEEALAFYREQANTSTDASVRQEARCKVALCLVGLQRLDEAEQLLQTLAQETGEHWPALAACRLWLIRLRRQQFAQADLVFATLSARYQREQLQMVVPEEVREAIRTTYLPSLTGLNIFRFRTDPEAVRSLERLIAVEDLLFDNQESIWPKYALLNGYRVLGRNQDALRVAEELLRQEEAAGPGGLPAAVVEQYGWLQRERGAAAQALDEINRRLGKMAGGDPREPLGLLPERARLEVNLGRWEPAEQDLETFLRDGKPADSSYHRYSGACLLRGFLRLRRGDEAGALAAWRQGVYTNWRAECARAQPDAPALPEVAAVGVSTDYMGSLNALILGSLTDDLSDAQAEAAVAGLFANVANDSPLAAAKGLTPFGSGVLRAMWRSPRGKEWARHFAYLDLSFADGVRVPPQLAAAELVRQDAFPDGLTAEQDALLWQTADDTLAALLGGKLSKTQVLQLVMAWKGSLDFFGWKSVAPKLAPALRGPLAYLIGHRYLCQKHPQDAAMLFEAAVADAPAGSVLQRLAQADLERLKRK
jgi:tetratricopeptide (TPR) repeat protein